MAGRPSANGRYALIGGACCVAAALVLAVVGAAGAGIYLYVRGGDGEPTGTGDPSAPVEDPSPDPDPEDLGSGPIVLPPGVEEDQPYVEVSTSADGPVLDIYLDFHCPPCKTFVDANADDLMEVGLMSEATLRMHPRPMLDAESQPPGYSSRAANAAVCAYAVKPEYWFPAQNALMRNQPGPEGLADEELADLIADEIGGGIDVSACIADGTYLPWLHQVVEPEALEAVPGTPRALRDGEPVPTPLAAPGAIRDLL